MKRVLTVVVAGAVLAGASAGSQADLTANVALTSDYVFRGISQTDENPAIQGGFDYSHSSGLYIGVWGSNVNFNDGDQAQLELDVYGGYSASAKKLGYDVGLIRYSYPGASGSLNYDYNEVYGKVSYDFGAASVTGGVNYSNDYFGASGNATYYFAEIAVPLPRKFSLTAHLGRQNIEKNGAFGTPDYVDYKIGVAREIGGFGLSLDWVDTNLSKSECFGGSSLCGSRVAFTVSKSM